MGKDTVQLSEHNAEPCTKLTSVEKVVDIGILNHKYYVVQTRDVLKWLPQMVQPVVNSVHLCPDMWCVPSLSNVQSV